MDDYQDIKRLGFKDKNDMIEYGRMCGKNVYKVKV